MLSTHTIDRVEHYWASHFGCSTDTLRAAGVKVLPRARQDSLWVFQYRDSVIWHVPSSLIPRISYQLGDRQPGPDTCGEQSIRQAVGDCLRHILGPCPIGYCDAGTLCRGDCSAACRMLTTADATAIENLAAACGREAWSHGGIDLARHPAVCGCFDAGRLVSAASYGLWGDEIAHVGVATAPAVRGRGFGKAAAAAATARAIQNGLVAQWRTLASNLPSVAIGRAIGYQPVASHFFVGLHPSEHNL